MNTVADKSITASFYILWIIIVAISVHDGYLVVLNRATIASYEQNPVGQWLIAADSGGITWLLLAKTLGTTLTASILLWWFWKRPQFSLCITAAVASAQLVLLWYLSNY